MELPEVVFSFALDGPYDAKGSAREVSCKLTATGIEWTVSGNLAKAINAAIRAGQENHGWRLITDNPPVDREFLGCRVNYTNSRTGERVPDMYFHIRGRHIDYAGGPAKWTWNEQDGRYGIVLTHWRELPALPSASATP
jgi:hypothetical protein